MTLRLRPSRRLLAVAAAASCAAAFALLSGAGHSNRASASQAPARGWQGQFAVGCRFGHRAPDDPIVKPGKVAGSHSHDFFGNFSTDTTSTRDSLMAAGSNCRRPGDLSAYWVPTLRVDNRPVAPQHAQIYYRTAGREPSSIRPFPVGMKLIAGNAAAQAPQDISVVNWACTPDEQVRDRTAPPSCPDGSTLKLQIRFPECWNGRDLDSADHRAHMAYAAKVRRRGMVCPDTHPVALPKVVMNIRYPVAGGSGVSLDSGPHFTAHADFFEAWDPRVQADLVSRCLNADVHCGQS